MGEMKLSPATRFDSLIMDYTLPSAKPRAM
jgi:hypothetical protein